MNDDLRAFGADFDAMDSAIQDGTKPIAISEPDLPATPSFFVSPVPACTFLPVAALERLTGQDPTPRVVTHDGARATLCVVNYPDVGETTGGATWNGEAPFPFGEIDATAETMNLGEEWQRRHNAEWVAYKHDCQAVATLARAWASACSDGMRLADRIAGVESAREAARVALEKWRSGEVRRWESRYV